MDRGELCPTTSWSRWWWSACEQTPRRVHPRRLPADRAQAEALEDALAAAGRPLTAVLKFAIADEMAVKRLTAGWTCPNCQRTYNVEFKPPRRTGICDVCGCGWSAARTTTRSPCARRLEVYHEQTEPLERFYRERGLLREVDADRRARTT